MKPCAFSRLLLPALFAASIAPFAPAQQTIEQLAPDSSFAVISVKNVAALQERFKSTGLWNLWQSENTRKMLAELMKDLQLTEQDLEKKYTDVLSELGLEKDDIVFPTGHVGLSFSPTESDDIDADPVDLLLVADFGPDADKAEKMFAALVENGEKKKLFLVEQADAAGRKVQSLEMLEPADEHPEEKPAGEMEAEEWEEEEWAQDQPARCPFKRIMFVREGASFFLSSDLNTLALALDAVDGKPHKSIVESQGYQRLASMVRHEQSDAYALAILDPSMWNAMGDSGAMFAFMAPMLSAAFGEIEGAALSFRLDAPDAMLQQLLALSMPAGKTGIPSLIDQPAPPADLPKFVAANSQTYTALNFEFNNLMGVIKEIMAANPMMQAPPEQFAEFENNFSPILGALQSQLHFSLQPRETAAGTTKTLVMAAPCAKPQEFETALAKVAPQMQLEPRDFLGHRIFSAPFPMFDMMAAGPGAMGDDNPADHFSIGIGAGFVFLGASSDVELALRAGGQEGAAALAADPLFLKAVASLPKSDSVAWGYTNTIDAMELESKISVQNMKSMAEQVREWDPEYADEMLQEAQALQDMWKKIDFNEFRKYIGPSAWLVQSTDDGFIMHSHTTAGSATDKE